VNPPDWTPRLLALWPTLVVRCRLEDHEPHDAGLVALVEKMDADAEQMTARYREIDILSLEHADIRWLRDGIDEAIRTYFAQVGVDYPVGWEVRGWANVNRRGDYHSPHNHGWSYLSGTYYVRVPTQPPQHAGGSPPAAISYYDPRAAVNMLAIGDEALAQREFPVRPEAGTLLLWNAFVNHSVHLNLAHESRISISFNVALKWSQRFVGG
jgi:uncharacterized protein (TIGR02466 family)